MSSLSAIKLKLPHLVPLFFFLCTPQAFEEFHLKMQIPPGEASSSLKENRGGKCTGSVPRGSQRFAAAFTNTAFGRKKFWPDAAFFPDALRTVAGPFPKLHL